ncbi:MAG: hypothetical protein WAM39_30625 [Bryobacteraceae bacterium]
MSIKPVLLLWVGLATAAQTDQYFTVGNIGVHLGDSEVSVLANLRAQYQVNSVGEETYVVGKQQGAVFEKLGTVSFENNALVSAGSTWNESFDASAVKLAKQIVAALEHQELEPARTAIIRRIHRGSDLAPVDGVEIVIGDRAIQIVTANAPAARPNQEYAAVTENLHQHSYAEGLAKEAGIPPR